MTMRQLQQNLQNPQNKRKKLINIIVMILTILIVFTACHKKKKPFLLLPLIDNSSVASTDSGSGGPTFTPAIGELDTSFNSPNGSLIQPIGSSHDYGQSLAIQPDGKILLGGRCQGASNFDFCIARFNSDGSLDTSFGNGGKVIQPIGSGHDYGRSLAIQSDGKILLGGYCHNGSNNDFCIARFDSEGNLDTTFGTGGKVIQGIGSGNDEGYSLAVQPDGKILLGGYCHNGSNNDFCIARFDSEGNLDTTFGNSGKVIESISSSILDKGYSLAIQPDGKILLGGYCNNRGNIDFCITRFKSDGTLDKTFGRSGKVIQPIGSDNDEGYSLAIQPDGKILLGGYCKNGSNRDFCIARFNSDGTLDTSFGSSGKVIQPIGSSNDEGYSLAIQSDGKILLGGFCDYEFCIARFNSDGTLDTTFGSSGKVIQPIGSANDRGQSLAIQPDGKILLGGYCSNGSNWDFCIARFNSNGTLDTTFGSSGKVIQPIGSSNDFGRSLVIQPDGKILLGGTCYNGSNDDFCIARFNSDGTLDTTFGSYGKIIQPIGSWNDYGYSLAIQPDGKILLGGYCFGDFCIARFQ